MDNHHRNLRRSRLLRIFVLGASAAIAALAPTLFTLVLPTYAVSLSANGPVGGVTSVDILKVDDDDVGENPGVVIILPVIMSDWPPYPDVPVIDHPANPIWDGKLTLNWQASTPSDAYPITHYVLEESPTVDFTGVVSFTVPAAGLPYTLPTKPYETMGTLYYRVSAYNAWGTSGWSETQPVLFLSLMDTFEYPETGWAPRRTSYWDLDIMEAEYILDDLVTRVEDRFDFAIFSPMQPAPAPPYALRVRTKVLHYANETSYGIVFGGNQGAFCDVNRWTADDPDGCFSHYYRLNVIWGGYLKYQLKRVDYHAGIEDGGSGEGKDWGYGTLSEWYGDPHEWNEWEIRVYDSGFALYANGEFLMWIADTKYIQDHYYGIFSSTFEYNGARFLHDYFYVEPLEGEDALPPVTRQSEIGPAFD